MKLNNRYWQILLVYVAIAVAFVVEVLLNQRGYQDSWILQDILLPTILYVFTFSVVAVLIDNNRLLTLVCASFVVILNAIPNLKYEFFSGTFDSVAHYGYINGLLSLGHVPKTGFYASVYQDFPGMHIFIGSLSTVTGLSSNVTMKLFTSLITGIIPLMAYFATNSVFKPSIQRYIIVASGLPTFMSYTLSGTTFGLILYFCITCLILRSLLTKSKRQHNIVLLILFSGVLFSHAMTTLYLISFLIIAVLLLKFLSVRQHSVLKKYQNTHGVVTGVLLIFVISFVARLTFESGVVLELFADVGESFLLGRGSAIVPSTFFSVPLSAKVTFLALGYVKDALVALMSSIGVIVLFTKIRHKNREVYKKFYPFLLCFVGAIMALMAFQFLSNFSGPGYQRFIDYAIVLSPFLVGLFLWHLSNHFGRFRFGSALVVLVLFSCISVSLIQIFPLQPISPRADVLSSDLPSNEYIFDFRLVNTVYQKKMILFAESFSSGTANVAADIVTRWQIQGFADSSFAGRVIYDSPLVVPNLSWDLFLLHYDGKAGPLNEKVENRTNERLATLKDDLGNNVIYDNGESFVLAKSSEVSESITKR